MPNNWAITSFEEIVELISGRDLETSSCNDIKEGIPYLIGASNIVKRSLFITRWTTKPIVISQKNDILISCKGTIGEVIRNTIGDIHIARQFMALRNNSIVDTNYIELYIRAILERIKSDARGVIPGISREDILCREILLPPLNEQKRIVLEASKLISIIEKINVDKNELVKAIAAYKLTILQLAITGKLVPQDLSDEPAIELLKRINPAYKPADNRHYENLPQNWEECALKDIVEIQNGYAFKSSLYSNDGVRVIRITNVQDGYIMDDSPKYYPLSHMDGLEDYMLKGNDLLMSLTGNVGRVAMMPAGLLPAALNQRVCCITPKSSEVCKEFLFYLLRTDSFITSCIESGKGVAQLNVSTEWLKSYRIALPPKDEQRRIVKAIQNIMTKIDKILADL